MTTIRTATANSTLAIGGVSSPLDSYVITQSSVHRTNFCGKIPAPRVAEKRYLQPQPNDRANINGRTERQKLPTLRKIKRGVCQRTSRHKTPHLILPDRTQAHPPPYFTLY